MDITLLIKKPKKEKESVSKVTRTVDTLNEIAKKQVNELVSKLLSEHDNMFYPLELVVVADLMKRRIDLIYKDLVRVSSDELISIGKEW